MRASELRVGTIIEGAVETVMGLEGVIVHIDESGTSFALQRMMN